MTTETDSNTNRELWTLARRRFDTMMRREIDAEAETDPGDVSRTIGILEAATVVEDMIIRAESAPQPVPELINLLKVLLDQIASLIVTEGGNK